MKPRTMPNLEKELAIVIQVLMIITRYHREQQRKNKCKRSNPYPKTI